MEGEGKGKGDEDKRWNRRGTDYVVLILTSVRICYPPYCQYPIINDNIIASEWNIGE